MRTLSFKDVLELVKQERDYQDKKWGTIEERSQSIPGFMLIAKKELIEAEDGWCKNVQGRHSALREMIQVAAVAIACLETHGGGGEDESVIANIKAFENHPDRNSDDLIFCPACGEQFDENNGTESNCGDELLCSTDCAEEYGL